MIGLHWTVTTRWLQAFFILCFISVEIGNRDLKEEFLHQAAN